MFTLDHELLEKLAMRATFEVPQTGLVLFGLRGMLPIDISGTDYERSHEVHMSAIDHRHMRCTLGIWRPEQRELAVFPGSTVPHRYNMKRQMDDSDRGIANMLMLGKYGYTKGIHKKGKPTGHRALRQNEFFPVWRTFDDYDYEKDDVLDNDGGWVWDNIHCASGNDLDRPVFGSAGCQVMAGVRGNPSSGEQGPWKTFIGKIYAGAGRNQKHFEYMLFRSNEVAMLARKPDGVHNRSCRFGSTGPYVARVQRALHRLEYPGFGSPSSIDGNFGRKTLEAVVAFQHSAFGKGGADGIAGTQTANALGIDWEPVDFRPAADPDAPDAINPDLGVPNEWMTLAARVTCGFETAGDPYTEVTGDFDGQGISCGALQFNIGQGTLQPVVTRVGEQLVRDKMPTYGQALWTAVTSSRAEGLRIVVGWQAGNRLDATAKAELQALLDTPEMRASQNIGMKKYARKAVQMAESYASARGKNAFQKRDFSFFFDVAVQNGSMAGVSYVDAVDFCDDQDFADGLQAICNLLQAVTGDSGHIDDARRNAEIWRDVTNEEQCILLILGYLRSLESRGRYQQVVFNRKGTIAAGDGFVNGIRRDLSQFGS